MSVGIRQGSAGAAGSHPVTGVAGSAACAIPRTLLDHLESAGTLLGKRASGVARLWLEGADAPETTREIARRHGVSAHRVRQVVAAALDDLDGRTGCLGPVRAGLRALRGRLPLPVDGLLGEAWARGLAPAAALWLAERQGGIHRIGMPGLGDVLASVPPDLWDGVIEAAGRSCAGARPDGLARDTALKALPALGLDPESLQACRKLLRALFGDRSNLSVALASGHDGLLLDALLPPGGGPVHLSDIQDRLERLAPGHMTPYQIRQFVEANSIKPVAGHHASLKGAGLPDPVARSLAHRCVSLAARHPGKRVWKTPELLEALRAEAGDLPEGLDALRLERVLVEQGALPRFGPMAWAWEGRLKGRVPLRRFVEDMLLRQGGPMARQAIQDAVREARGGESPGDLWISGRLIELEGDRWGLVDRDLDLTPGECREVIETVSGMVDAPGVLSLASVRKALGSGPLAGRLPDPVALRCLLTVHGGLVIGVRGRIRKRIGTRPAQGISFTRRIVEVLASHPEGIRSHDLVSAVTALAGKAPTDAIVKNVLWRYGKRDAEDPAVWRLLPAEEVRPRTRSVLSAELADGDRRHAYPKVRKPAETGDRYDWAPQRERLLIRMAAEGAGSTRIAAALGGGISRNAVISKARRLGVTVGR